MNKKIKISGILSIVTGSLALIGFGILAVYMLPNPNAQIILPIMLPVTFIVMLMGILAIIGGVYTLKKKVWRIALVGAIASIIILYPTGTLALVFLMMSEDEFKKEKQTSNES